MASKQSRGTCTFCGRELTRSGLARHLPVCPDRRAAIERANGGSGRKQRLFHLQVQDDYAGAYWLHLEMNGTARMLALDSYLRAIWLECCDHLSKFGDWQSPEIPMDARADRVFEPGVNLIHIYDFGTSSETRIRVVGVREGKPLTGHPIVLMARNSPLEARCPECGRPAVWWCSECEYHENRSGLYCDEHAEADPHGEYHMPIVNSPRVGMCGYWGPAEPPY